MALIGRHGNDHRNTHAPVKGLMPRFLFLAASSAGVELDLVTWPGGEFQEDKNEGLVGSILRLRRGLWDRSIANGKTKSRVT